MMNKLKVLIGCEESQEVTKAFRNLGIEAYSCDILPCSGGYPEWHYQADIFEIIHLNNWNCLIVFPPCTYLTVAGNRHIPGNPERWEKRYNAIKFVWELLNVPIKHIAIENPVGVLSTYIRKPEQIIQPYEFGEPESKKTCLWLKNLPMLKKTNILKLPECGYWGNQTPGKQNKILHNGKWLAFNNPLTAQLRSKTYPGIAKAMADQWGEHLLNEKHESQ